jgi:hypothetical protein
MLGSPSNDARSWAAVEDGLTVHIPFHIPLSLSTTY